MQTISFSLLLLLISIQSSLSDLINPSPNNGFQITDLTTKDLTTFAFTTQGWNISGLAVSTSNSSLCGANFPLLGGSSIFANDIVLEKNYTALPSHTAMYFQIHFALIDKFKNPDFISLSLSGMLILSSSSLKTYNSYLTSNICGGADPDTTQFTLMGLIPHTSDVLAFKILAKAATGAGSGTIGVRDISLIFVNDSSIVSTKDCFRVYDTTLTGLSGECQCEKGYYYNSGTCTTCDPSCGDCFGGSSSQCFSCVSGFSWTGTHCEQCDSSCLTCSGPNNNQCLTCQAGLWLQKNGTCTPSCNLPASASQVVGVLQVCETICQDPEYFLFNGGCAASCPAPLVSSTIDSNFLCNKPCQTGEFFDYHGSCVSSCSSPYVQAINNSVDVCNLPCDPVSEFLYPNGSCSGSCGGFLVSTFASDIQWCNSPCGADFMYADGSCNSQCNSPLVVSTVMGIQYCSQPCQTGEFLDFQGNCISSCSSPYVQDVTNNVDICSLPCDPVSEFLYPDSSCSSSCNSPFVSTVSSNIQWCNSPCGTDFTYSDYSCNPQCNSPLLASTVLGINYCDSPCGTTGFINPNSSCRAQCDPPLVSATYNSINWCASPCSYYLDYFYPNNNTCQPSCLSPATIENYDLVSVCRIPAPTSASAASTLTTEEKNSVNQANAVTNSAGATARATTATSSLVSSGSPNAISLISLMKMLDYIRYINIDYPPKLQYFLDSKAASSVSLNFHITLPQEIQDEFPNYPLPGKFGEYGLASSFIINYCEELFTSALIFMILALATVLTLHVKKVKYLSSFFVKVKNVIQWNLILIVICSNMDSVGVYSSLELRTTPFNSFLSVMGTLICIVVNLVAVFLMGFTLYITYSLWRSRKSVSPSQFKGSKPQETDEKYLNCGVLYLNFRKGSLLQRSCMFFILLRIYLFNMVIGYLFDHPLAQAILIVLMSFMMLAFLSFKRPFRKAFDLVKAITYESIIFVVNICILILAIMDHKGVYLKEERVRLGDVIILANTLFNVAAVLFIGVEIIFRLIKVYRISKKIKSRGMKFWTKILVTLFEPEDMEEVTEEQAKKKKQIYCDPVSKETIQIKSLFEIGSRNETHFDIEKSSQICLKNSNSKITPTIEPANSILSFEGLSENGSRRNLLPNMRSTGSILHNFPGSYNLELMQKRQISRLSLNQSPVFNRSQASFQELEVIKLASIEAPSSRTPSHSQPKEEEKRSCKLSENIIFLESIGSSMEIKKRRRIGFNSPSHFSHDNIVNLSFESDQNTPTYQIHSAGFPVENAKFSLCTSNFKPGDRGKKSSP